MENITIVLVGGINYKFIGRHRPDMEKPNWHYYEVENGGLYHFRKEHMISVYSCPV